MSWILWKEVPADSAVYMWDVYERPSYCFCFFLLEGRGECETERETLKILREGVKTKCKRKQARVITKSYVFSENLWTCCDATYVWGGFIE